MFPRNHNNNGGNIGDDLILSPNNFDQNPDSFTERFSSIDHDELENTIKIGRGGAGDLDDDVRLFRDIEIRLKIEPLTIKLIHSITERIRTHVHA
jgi:hypothetical protein